MDPLLKKMFQYYLFFHSDRCCFLVRVNWLIHTRTLTYERDIDELVPVYIVFRTPHVEEATLKSYLARLAINVEAFAFSTAPPQEQEAKGPPPKESIFSETVKDSVEPVIVHHESGGSEHIYVVWKLDTFICERTVSWCPMMSDMYQLDREGDSRSQQFIFSRQHL